MSGCNAAFVAPTESSPVNPPQVTAVPAFNDNYLWLVHGRHNPAQVIAVDPGDAAAIRRVLLARDLRLSGILVTHHHNDHVGGVAALQSEFEVPIYAPATEVIPGKATPVTEGATVQFAELDLQFNVLTVPGHTAGHIAYLTEGALFCGDTLFSAGCGRLFEGTPEQMSASLRKLAALPADTLVYCAHEYTLSNLQFARAVEPDNTEVQRYEMSCQTLRAAGQATLPTSMGLELKINPFLRLREQSVKQAAEHYCGRQLDSESTVFAVLREWKNHFKG